MAGDNSLAESRSTESILPRASIRPVQSAQIVQTTEARTPPNSAPTDPNAIVEVYEKGLPVLPTPTKPRNLFEKFFGKK